VPTSLPFPSSTLASRAGFPVLVLSLAGAMHTSPFVTAATLPPSVAVAIALAAGAFLSWSVRGDRWTFGLAAIVVGVSAMVVRLYLPETYSDSMCAMALVAAGMLPALSYLRDGRGFIAATVLIGTAGVAHGPLFALFIGVLGLVTLTYLPESWRGWRAGSTPALTTPAGRLAAVLGAAVALPAVAIFGLLRAAPNTPHQIRSEYLIKFREDLSLYWFPLTIPLAAIGAAAAAGWKRLPLPRDAERDAGRTRVAMGFLLRLSIAWAAVTVVVIVAFLAGMNLPAHRFLAFFLPLPLLVALGVVAVAALVERRAARRDPRTSRRAGFTVAAAGVAILTLLGGFDLYVQIVHRRGAEWLTVAKAQDSATANAYLDAAGVPVSSPVVYVFDKPNPRSDLPEMTYVMRSVLSPDRMQHVHVYLGTPENYQSGRPTYDAEDPTYDFTEGEYWPGVAKVLPQHPVALLLKTYTPAFGRIASAHPDWVVGPGVVALGGGKPGVTVGAATLPAGLGNPVAGLLFGVGTIVLLFLAGLGWSLALVPSGTRGFEALALAPAFGIAGILLTGVVLDTVLGIRLHGAGGAAAVLVPLVAGALLAARRLRRNGLETFPAA
jgi:MFS family permease